jgi:hypothetical protein
VYDLEGIQEPPTAVANQQYLVVAQLIIRWTE